MSKALINVISLLVCIQLLCLNVGERGEKLFAKTLASNKRHFSISAFLYFDENRSEEENEDEDKKLTHSFEIADLSDIQAVLNRTHTSNAAHRPINQLYYFGPPLFKLNCVYII